MTIPATPYRADYVGNGAVATYPFSFKIFDQTQLTVTVQAITGVLTTLALTTDYTVNFSSTAGSITLVAGNLTNGYNLAIVRTLPLSQLTDIRDQGDFYASTHEDEFDRLTMQDQQQQDAIDRSIKLPKTEVGGASSELPAAMIRANMVIGFDALGAIAALANVPTSGIAATSFGEALIQSAAASGGRTVLGLTGAGGVIVAGDLAANSVTTVKILDANVTTAKILDGNVTVTKLAEAVRANMVLYSAPSSAANAYVIAPSPAFTAFVSGMGIVFKSDFQNTGAATVNPNALGAKALVDREGAALVGGEIKVGMMVRAYYDGTSFVCPDILSRSDVWLYTANGHGSTNVKIRRFTTVGASNGASITYVDSATNGATFNINKSGVYAVSYTEQASIGGDYGVSVNSNQLSTGISAITAADRRVYYSCDNSSTCFTTLALTMYLSSGDFVRAHTNGTQSATTSVMFRVTRVG